MGFFEDSTVDEIAQSHIQELARMEEAQARKIVRRYREVRQALRDRLDRLPQDRFTAQQLRGVLIQVETALDAMNSGLLGALKTSAGEVSKQGIDDLYNEIKTYEKHFRGAVVPLQLDRIAMAVDANNFLFNKYETSIAAYSADVRATIAAGLSQAAIEEIPTSEAVRRLGKFFGDEEWKLQRIARTEMHGVYNYSKQIGMTETRDLYMPDLKKALIHPMDSRTGDDSKYADKLNLVAKIEEPFEYKWKGKLRKFMAPPDRPNDRSIMVPYRPDWDKQ